LNHRLERVNITIQKELGPLISTDLNDPRLTGIVSVTKVDVAPDLSTANVFVSIVSDDGDPAETLEALQSAAGHLSRELNSRIKIRRVPRLRFSLDTQLADGNELDALIDQALHEDRRLRSRRQTPGE